MKLDLSIATLFYCLLNTLFNLTHDTLKLYLRNIVIGIKENGRIFAGCNFRHIGRAGNQTTLALAQYALEELNIIWMEDIHLSLYH